MTMNRREELALAAAVCLKLRDVLKRRALRADESQHESGAYGNWLHAAESLRLAAKALERERETL